jgi:transcriptional regulator GlxA family with amidase domain
VSWFSRLFWPPFVSLFLPQFWLRFEHPIYTSAGITAGIDLALALVEEEHGHAVELNIARFLVMFLVRPRGQAQFSYMLAHQAVASKPLRELQV